MPFSAPTDRRDRLLVELLAADPTAALLVWNAEVALLVSAAELGRILVMTVPEDLPSDRLPLFFSAHMRALPDDAQPTQIVAVGGGPEATKALAATIPLFVSAQMGFDHLDASGSLKHVKSRELPLLEHAAMRIAMDAPLDPEPLADARARGRKLVEQLAAAPTITVRSTVTTTIAAACIVLAGLTYWWGGESGYGEALFRMGANEVGAVKGGEPWRLLSSAFLHGGALHLGMNMMALWVMGPVLEGIFGPRRFLILYGASALGGSLLSAFAGGSRMSVGASGAIWGLMTAFLALALRPRGVIPAPMAAVLRRRARSPIVLNLGLSLLPGIDLLGHLGGGLVGFALVGTVLTRGLVPVDQRREPTAVERTRSPLVTGAAVVVAAAMALSVIVALVTGRPWNIGRAEALTLEESVSASVRGR